MLFECILGVHWCSGCSVVSAVKLGCDELHDGADDDSSVGTCLCAYMFRLVTGRTPYSVIEDSKERELFDECENEFSGRGLAGV